jgi:hypothetical protein
VRDPNGAASGLVLRVWYSVLRWFRVGALLHIDQSGMYECMSCIPFLKS